MTGTGPGFIQRCSRYLLPTSCLVLRTCGSCRSCALWKKPPIIYGSRQESLFLQTEGLGAFPCSIHNKESGLFFLNFKGWLCQVEHGGENDCMVKMLASIIVVLPKTWCILCRPGRSLSACSHRQTATVLKFWKAEAGWVCKAAQLRSPGNLPLSSDVGI